MNKRRAIILAAALLGGLVLVLPAPNSSALLTVNSAEGSIVEGSTVEGPAITWWVVAGGGGKASAAGEVAVNGTLGQPIIGPAGGDSVSLGVGYWYGAMVKYRIYLPLVLREYQ